MSDSCLSDQHILYDPSFGWCSFTLFGWTCPRSASYLEDYPVIVPESFNELVKTQKTSFVLDCEGQWYTISLVISENGIDMKVFEFDGEDEDDIIYHEIVSLQSLRQACEVLAADLVLWKDEWLSWVYPDDEDELNSRTEEIDMCISDMHSLASLLPV